MNFGDRLKQLRTQKSLTQPQLAQAIGIEQSYLSKLENDKSIPGADIFQSILRALGTDVATFLQGVDEQFVHRELRQVPEVANHLNAQSSQRVHSVKKWLYISAVLGVVGATLVGAGYKELLFPGSLHYYESHGVVHPDEPSEFFSTYEQIELARLRAGEFDEKEYKRRQVAILGRFKEEMKLVRESRGNAFIEEVPGGTRYYKFRGQSTNSRAENRYLMLAGLLLSFASLFGFFVEARLRNLKR